ncbi:hypothetical protein KH5H1_64970 [Corallococcus caeni]|nr:hypothetical protein KH5H1_64970 [Corallococcus sp. KH5-1]
MADGVRDTSAGLPVAQAPSISAAASTHVSLFMSGLIVVRVLSGPALAGPLRVRFRA